MTARSRQAPSRRGVEQVFRDTGKLEGQDMDRNCREQPDSEICSDSYKTSRTRVTHSTRASLTDAANRCGPCASGNHQPAALDRGEAS